MSEALPWYKNAVIYELHIRAFHDSNGDGTGDFRGLIQKLDYLADLGVTAIWVLPFYPSPLKDDGYDIADYKSVHPNYGDLEDFKLFLSEAHRRGLKVITELVINHTSDQHEWFQRSRRDKPGGYWRNFYVWSDDPNRYKEVRIIFKDFEPSNWTWDPVAKSYFWHRFYSHQPDLNFDNPEVQKAIFEILDYWMEMGVDGLRLDAIPYLFEREGTSCENLPETHAFLKKLREHVDKKYPDRMLLAEANQWPEDAVGYFGGGDECHMCFHFPLMPRLFMAIRMEDRYSILDILRQTPTIPENCQWAMFLRNHDELTLEMVTDEERDYMYKVYASDPKAAINLGIRRRLAPLVSNDRRQIELLNGLLFSLTGTPVLYYGDEIGMGDNIHLGDRNGVRTPFQWSPDRNAGFSKADPQSLFLPLISSPEYHYETLNVETAQKNENSLLWWTKKLIAIRKNYAEFSSGALKFIESENSKVLSFVREGESTILVVANLSRKVQCVELDLSAYRGHVPSELFGQVDFPPVGEKSYFLTLNPYAFYWFELKKNKYYEIEAEKLKHPLPLAAGADVFEFLRRSANWARFEKKLISYLPKTRWFLGKGRVITGCQLVDVVELKNENGTVSHLNIVAVSYRDEETEHYLLPLSFREGAEAEKLMKDCPKCIITTIQRAGSAEAGGVAGTGVLFESTSLPEFAQTLVTKMVRNERVDGVFGTVMGRLESAVEFPYHDQPVPLPQTNPAEQSNTSFAFERNFFFKLYRKLESGKNPEITIGRHLHQTQKFPQAPQLLGVAAYVNHSREYPIGCLQNFVESHGDGWSLFLSQLSQVVDAANATLKTEYKPSFPMEGFGKAIEMSPPEELQMLAGITFSLAQLLGRRTAEMHLALSDAYDKPEFQPEAYTPFYQRSLYQSYRNMAVKSLGALRKAMPELPPEAKELALQTLKLESAIFDRLGAIKNARIDSMKTRVHGDYHLGQVLYTGKDFFIIDFEGEPKRPLGERVLKRTPLVDVAGMIRSFDYLASYYLKEKLLRPEDAVKLTSFISNWSQWMAAEYLKAYLEVARGTHLVPREGETMLTLLEVSVLDKALYELGYELAARPAWVDIPLKGIAKILGGITGADAARMAPASGLHPSLEGGPP